MHNIIELETRHLLLRQWKSEDYTLYAELTSNQDVMKFFPHILTKEQSNTAAKKFENLITSRGWGFWAVENKESNKFLGYAGLHVPATKFPFSPCIEIAWRVEDKYWRNGYVLEAGKEILRCSFEDLGLEEIVYFTSVLNHQAEVLMEELGMKNKEENFKHPSMPSGHDIEEHKLYRITKKEWIKFK